MAALFALAVMLAVVIISDHPAKGLADVIGDPRVERYFVPARGEVASRRSQRCTREIASAVISPSSFGRAIKKKLRRFVEAGAGPILGYGIDELLCRDVTRDGRREMVVLLKCCTANTPTPWAIFARRSGSWRPIFQVVSRKISVSDLRVSKKGDVLEKLPRYEQGDALCCPSRYSYRVTHWNGSRFVVRSERP